MKKRNSAGRLLAILLVALLVPAMAACSAKDGDQKTEQTEKTEKTEQTEQTETGSVTSDEPQNEEEALALYKELMEQENKILSENTDLWEKVYLEADKGMAMLEDGKNYGEFLLKTIEAVKDQFTEEELKTLQSAAEKISELESRLTMLEEKYPEDITPEEAPKPYIDTLEPYETDDEEEEEQGNPYAKHVKSRARAVRAAENSYVAKREEERKKQAAAMRLKGTTNPKKSGGKKRKR